MMIRVFTLLVIVLIPAVCLSQTPQQIAKRQLAHDARDKAETSNTSADQKKADVDIAYMNANMWRDYCMQVGATETQLMVGDAYLVGGDKASGKADANYGNGQTAWQIAESYYWEAEALWSNEEYGASQDPYGFAISYYGDAWTYWDWSVCKDPDQCDDYTEAEILYDAAAEEYESLYGQLIE